MSSGASVWNVGSVDVSAAGGIAPPTSREVREEGGRYHVAGIRRCVRQLLVIAQLGLVVVLREDDIQADDLGLGRGQLVDDLGVAVTVPLGRRGSPWSMVSSSRARIMI